MSAAEILVLSKPDGRIRAEAIERVKEAIEVRIEALEHDGLHVSEKYLIKL